VTEQSLTSLLTHTKMRSFWKWRISQRLCFIQMQCNILRHCLSDYVPEIRPRKTNCTILFGSRNWQQKHSSENDPCFKCVPEISTGFMAPLPIFVLHYGIAGQTELAVLLNVVVRNTENTCEAFHCLYIIIVSLFYGNVSSYWFLCVY